MRMTRVCWDGNDGAGAVAAIMEQADAQIGMGPSRLAIPDASAVGVRAPSQRAGPGYDSPVVPMDFGMTLNSWGGQ